MHVIWFQVRYNVALPYKKTHWIWFSIKTLKRCFEYSESVHYRWKKNQKNNSIRTYLIIYSILRIILVVPTTCRWFSPGPPVSSNNKTDRRDITEILLKVTLNTIKQTNKTNHCPTLSWLGPLMYWPLKLLLI